MPNPRTLSLLSLLLAPALLRADPINCLKAASPTEKTICGDTTLVQLDARMDTEYTISLGFLAMGSAGAQRDLQRQFPAQRDACGTDKTCIRDLYNKRIAAFDSTIAHVRALGPF